MATTKRSYDHDRDFELVKSFLVETFFQKDSYQLWIPTRFENSVFIDENRSENVHVWLDSTSNKSQNSQILVGLVILDQPNGFILISHPRYKYLVEEMIFWAEQRLKKPEITQLVTYSIRDNTIQNAILTKLGFSSPEVIEHTRTRPTTTPISDYILPDGFQIRPISTDDYDKYVKAVEIVFNHSNFTHEVYTAMRKTQFYHKDLNLGAFTEDGNLAAFSMVRIDEYKIAEFEPVGTLPEFRKRGLATALLKESLIQAKKYDPSVFYVGGAPTEEADRLYGSLGFIKKTNIYRWVKKLI